MSTLNTEVTTDYFRESHSVPNQFPNLSLSHLKREKKPTLVLAPNCTYLVFIETNYDHNSRRIWKYALKTTFRGYISFQCTHLKMSVTVWKLEDYHVSQQSRTHF